MGKITYIAGRVLKIGNKFVQPGEEVDPSIFPRIESLVSSGRLYRVYEGKDTRLPPWLAKAVKTREEAEAKLAGDPTKISDIRKDARERHEDSQEVRVAEAEAIMRREGPSAHEKAQAVRVPIKTNPVRPPTKTNPFHETNAEKPPVQTQSAKKATTKKATPKKESK